MKSPTVFVLQEQPNHDISPALEHGSIEVVLPPQDFNFSKDHVFKQIADKLKGYTDNDWLLLTGDPVAIAMASCILTTTDKVINVLKWNRQTRTYIPLKDISCSHITMEEIDGTECG